MNKEISMNTIAYCIVFIAALLVSTATVLLAFKKSQKRLLIAGVGVFFSLTLLFFPADNGGGVSNIITRIITAIFRSIRVFGLNEDLVTSEFNFSELPNWFGASYTVFLDFLYLIAPILTFGLIVSIFNNISSSIMLTFYLSREICVFSEKNLRAEIIAEDIRKKDPRSVIVFFNSDNSTHVKKDKTLFFDTSVLKINKAILKHSKHITFYICGDDKSENLKTTMDLLEIIGKYPRLVNKLEKNFQSDSGIDIFYFYPKRLKLPIMSNINKHNVRVRRVNEAQNLIYNLIYEEPILKYVNKETGTVNIAVVGAGKYGEEFIRAAIWSGQHRKYKININVFDKENVKDLFTNRYPELVNTEQLLDKSDINYKINFFDNEDFCNINIESIKEMEGLNLAFIALGNDDDNIEAALYLRECSERMNASPRIFTPVTDVNLMNANMTGGLKNHKGESFGIDLILPEYVFSHERAIMLEKMGKHMHKMWTLRNNPKLKESEIDYTDFYDYEFFYWSSVASTMFWKLRKKLGEDIQLSEDNIRLEHQRWCAYMRSEGYRYAEKRNDMARQHNCLKDFDSLSEKNKENDKVSIEFANRSDENE